jgi:NAD(P) transhydrogenase
MNYELLVIGNGREAIDGALAAAHQGNRVALVQPRNEARSGFPIEVLRDAVQQIVAAGTVSMRALRNEVARIERCQQAADRAELDCLGVDVITGDVRFVNATTVEVDRSDVDHPRNPESITAESILLACGTVSARPSHLRWDGRRILDVESLLALEVLPHTMTVVGAGQTGLDYAVLLAKLGVEVTVIDEQADLLTVCGWLMEDSRWTEAQSLDIAFRLGDEVIGVEAPSDSKVKVRLASLKSISTDAVLVCVGRVGATNELNLDAAGVGVDEHGRIWCDANGRTWASRIRAVGDVVGFRSTRVLAG